MLITSYKIGKVHFRLFGTNSRHDRRFISQAGRTRYFARSATRARSARRRGEEKSFIFLLPASRALREISRSPHLAHKAPVIQARHEWFPRKGKERKIYCCRFALSWEPQIWTFHVVVWPIKIKSKNCSKKRVVRAAWLFFLIQPIKSSICGVVVTAAVVMKLAINTSRAVRNTHYPLRAR